MLYPPESIFGAVRPPWMRIGFPEDQRISAVRDHPASLNLWKNESGPGCSTGGILGVGRERGIRYRG